MLNVNKGKIAAIIAIIISIFSFYSAFLGIFNKEIYSGVIATGVFSKLLEPGTLSQDIISVLAAIVLVILSIIFLTKPKDKIFISILGLIAYFLYGYGLFVVTGIYNSLYLIYMVIFILCIYGLIFGLTSFDTNKIKEYKLPKSLRMTIGIFHLIIAIAFIILWTASLMPYIQSNTRPIFYGVYIMDLVIVMPAFIVIAIMLIKNKPFGNILCGVALLKTLTLILSVTIGELLAPLYGNQISYPMVGIYSFIIIFSLILEIQYLRKYKKEVKSI